MPLTAQTTDLFQKVGLPGSATTLSSPGYTIGNASITVGATTNHPSDTKYTFAIDQAQVVNGVTSRIPGTYCEFEGILGGGNTIGSLTLKYGSAQNYPAGALTRVYIPVSANRENQLIVGLRQDHNGKGNHQSLTDDNGNAWLTRSQVASAVNSVQAANAATGGIPSLSAVGSDTDIGLDITTKGAGIIRLNGSAPKQFIQNAMYNFIESGCVWSGNAYGSTLLASMTAGVVWIAGKRLTVASVTSRAFTASKDTYVDFQDAGNGTATVIYTETTNNAASPAIPNSLADATNVRNAIIVSGATNIAAAGSVNQGQEYMILPIVAGVPYGVTDSLGNLICPRDPNRRILGLRTNTGGMSTGNTTATQITGLSVPVIVPTGRKVKITITGKDLFTSTASTGALVTIWEGVVGSGTQLADGLGITANGSGAGVCFTSVVRTPTTSSVTYNGGLHAVSAATAQIQATATEQLQMTVELY